MTYNDDIPVRRLSREEIESMARPWSDVGAPTDSAVIDMLYLYRASEVALIARSDVQMGEDLALAAPQLNRVLVRESQLRAAECR